MPIVAEQLNSTKTATKKDNQWCPRAIGDVLRNELYTGQYSVGDVTEYVDEYRIIPDEVFEEVTSVRLRFQIDSAKRKQMEPSRKQQIVEGTIEEYGRYLEEN